MSGVRSEESKTFILLEHGILNNKIPKDDYKIAVLARNRRNESLKSLRIQRLTIVLGSGIGKNDLQIGFRVLDNASMNFDDTYMMSSIKYFARSSDIGIYEHECKSP